MKLEYEKNAYSVKEEIAPNFLIFNSFSRSFFIQFLTLRRRRQIFILNLQTHK